jgi:hypothetical protein
MALFIVVLVGVDDHSGYSFPCSPFRLFPFVVDAVSPVCRLFPFRLLGLELRRF